MATITAVADTDELAVAKSALRDGLWSVARQHALAAGGDEAHVVVLEAWARESKWTELLAAMGTFANSTGTVFASYRALAELELGRPVEAAAALADLSEAEVKGDERLSRLVARIRIAEGKYDAALGVLLDSPMKDTDSRVMAAEAYSRLGKRKESEELWRTVAATSNVTESVYAAAAVNLGDVTLMREAYAKAKSPQVKWMVALRLGLSLVTKAETAAEGEKLIRSAVKDDPGRKGAREAYLAMADSMLARGDYAAAAETFAAAAETWPECAKDSSVWESRGWALSEAGKKDEALGAFRRAEELATNDSAKASAAVKSGDMLRSLGRADEAMTVYREVLAKYPSAPVSAHLKEAVRLMDLEAKGRSFYAAYRFAEARKIFAELGAEVPSKRSQMEYFEMLCLYGLGLDDKAETKAKAIVERGADAAYRAEATMWLAKHAYNRAKFRDSYSLFSAYSDMAGTSAEAPWALVWAAKAADRAGDPELAIKTVARLTSRYPKSPAAATGYLVQGEALIELARLDEASAVLDLAVSSAGAGEELKTRARVLKADALFAMGADNPGRYREALKVYRAIRSEGVADANLRIVLSFKIARTLGKLGMSDEAIDEYYARTVLAYRTGREAGIRYSDEARAAFSRAAFALADEYEARGGVKQAVKILELVAASDVPAAAEAEARMARLDRKGMFK